MSPKLSDVRALGWHGIPRSYGHKTAAAALVFTQLCLKISSRIRHKFLLHNLLEGTLHHSLQLTGGIQLPPLPRPRATVPFQRSQHLRGVATALRPSGLKRHLVSRLPWKFCLLSRLHSGEGQQTCHPLALGSHQACPREMSLGIPSPALPPTLATRLVALSPPGLPLDKFIQNAKK